MGAFFDTHGVYALFTLFTLCVVAALTVEAVIEAVTDIRHTRRRRDLDIEAPAFTCPKCGATSFHPLDARYGYCGRCHDYTGRPADLDADDRRTA